MRLSNIIDTRWHQGLLLILIAFIAAIGLQLHLILALAQTSYSSTQNIVIENDDEAYYLTLIRQAGLSNPTANPFFEKYTDYQWTYPMMGVRFEGYVMRSMHWDLKTTSIVFDLVTAFLISLLVLLLFRYSLKNEVWAYSAGLVYLFLPDLAHFWSRPINPQLSFLPLLIAITLLVKIGHLPLVVNTKKRGWIREILLGFFCAVLFYTYPFHWTFILPWMILIDVRQIIIERAIKGKMVLRYLVLCFVALPAILYSWHIQHLPYYSELMERTGLIRSHLPTGIALQIVLFICLCIWFWNERELIKAHLWYELLGHMDVWFMGLITSLIVLNQPIITGIQLELNAHYSPVIKLVIVAFLFKEGIGLVEKRSNNKIWSSFARIVQIVLPILLIILSLFGNNPFKIQATTEDQMRQEVITFLKTHTDEQTIISVPDELTLEVGYQANARQLFSPLERLFLVSSAELIDRFSYYDVSNPDVFISAERDQLPVTGFTYLAQRQKHENLQHLLARLHISYSFTQEWEENRKSVYSQIERQRRQALDPGYLFAGLKKYGVTVLVFRREDALYDQLPGDTLFENKIYHIKQLP